MPAPDRTCVQVATPNSLPESDIELAGQDLDGRKTRDRQLRSNRSRFMTLIQAATKSRTNFSCASRQA